MSDHVVVIPVYNERASIADVVRSAARHGAVLVVDDGSTDDSGCVAQDAGADVVRLPSRRGKGEALRRGMAEALARGADRVLTMDGDGQHDADDIPGLLAAADRWPDALVIGGRLSALADIETASLPRGRLLAIRVAGFFIDWLTGTPIQDTQSGFRVYPAALLASVPPRRGGFVLESEMLVRAADAGWRLVEVPVRAIHFSDRRSRFRPFRDGVAVGAYLAQRGARRWCREAAVVGRALTEPFTAARRRSRHRELAEFTAAHRHHPASWAAAVGVFTLACIASTWEAWWRDPRGMRMRVAAAASAATPVLLVAALVAPALRRLGIDPLTPLVRRLYSQERLAGTGAPPERQPVTPDTDVLVIGAGPGGSTAATLLARQGLSVTVVERQAFPRFHIGESLLPANVPVLERLGVLDRVRASGFIVKYGATFHDQDSGVEQTFYFRPGPSWPPYSFEVPRAEFDRILLEHAAAEPGVTLLQPATVEDVALDSAGATARIRCPEGDRELRARFVVDASGRDAFIASRHGRRRPLPGLGKVAVFAHFRGARRWPGKDEGNIRVFLFDGGWFWWIPFAGDVTSIGCVVHARTARERRGSLAELFDGMIARCHEVRDGLASAERVTAVHSAANFSYWTEPITGDRFVCVGDAVAFVDPVFSTGVFVAMRSAEMAAVEIARAFREDRFEARRFRSYERRLRRGVRPFVRFIRSYYDPAFLEVFLSPRPAAGMLDAVTGVLAGGTFSKKPLRMRMSLALFFLIVRLNRLRRWRGGRPIESRLTW